MSDQSEPTIWERVRYWPWTKEQFQRPRVVAIRAALGVFMIVFISAMGGADLSIGLESHLAGAVFVGMCMLLACAALGVIAFVIPILSKD